MIPKFPDFKFLQWDDREAVETFTNGFLPYSDFNFISLCSWNTREKMMLSELYGNLVVLFYDYILETPFLSFIGRNNISETAQALLEHSKQNYQINYLKLIPEVVATDLSVSEFLVIHDEDSHDYILSVSFLLSLKNQIASKLTSAGKGYKRFIKLYPQYHTQIFTGQEISVTKYLDMFKRWANDHDHSPCELNEFKAFERFINYEKNENSIVSIFDGDKMIGFATIEILSDEYAVVHFGKADTAYKGIYDSLLYEVGKMLDAKGITYLNFEQDLGIPALQYSKKKYKPVFYLKKFIVTAK